MSIATVISLFKYYIITFRGGGMSKPDTDMMTGESWVKKNK